MNQKEITLRLPADVNQILEFEYGGFPREWSIQETFQGALEISKETVTLVNQDLIPLWGMTFIDAPRFKNTMEISLPGDLVPVMGGRTEIQLEKENTDGSKIWKVESDSTVEQLYAGDDTSRKIPLQEGEVELIYSRKHEEIMEEIRVEEILRQVFDYCTLHYGSLGIGEENGLRLLETSIHHMGGYAMDGMSVMYEGSFGSAVAGDARKGASGAEVMAHEIIHQWWGLMCQVPEDPDRPEWSSEGLTVYTTYRLPNSLRQLVQLQKSTVEQYSLMPLKIWKAGQILGEEKLDEILKGLFAKGFEGCTYDDFLAACGLEEGELHVQEADVL